MSLVKNNPHDYFIIRNHTDKIKILQNIEAWDIVDLEVICHFIFNMFS